MKKILLVIAILGFFGSFIIPKSAEAAYVEIGSFPLTSVVYSPDSQQTDNTLLTYVYLDPSGSVTIGPAWADEGDSQPVGIYGVGVSLAPLGLVPGYNIAFDTAFLTYDSDEYDLFGGVITQGDYYWNGGTVIGEYWWGGQTEGVLEGHNTVWQLRASVPVTPANDYYYQVLLETTDDEIYPSWGTFSDVSIEAVPEPASTMLLGFGLVGFVGGVIRKKFKV